MMLQNKISAVAPARASRKLCVTKASATDAKAWIGAWQQKKAAQANRASWYPGTELPAHLDGSLPGDFGFDPLSLGVDSGKLRWYRQAELVHARFAMLGAAGVLFPELLKAAGLGGAAAATPWYEAGAFEYSLASPKTLFAVQILLFAWVELRRLQDYRKPGSAGQDPIFSQYKLPDGGEVGYPGGIFDPLGYSKGGEAALTQLKIKEIKNGRLAMLATLGFAAQAYTTGKTPIENLSTHLASPWSTTVFSNDLARLLGK